MTDKSKLTQPAREMLGVEVAPAGNDWAFFNKLSTMPNPDPILRRIGRAESVYASIMADAHVTGDVRSIRGSFRAHYYRVLAGDDADQRSKDARDLCEWWLEHSQPNVVAQDWLEVMWQMCTAIFTGFKVHEVVWDNVSGKWLPVMVKDRANSRFKFDANGAPLLLTRDNPSGMVVEPYQFVVSRHMATCDNPYGEALLSRCFWPWTFKTGGFKYFMQFCEKFGMPWPFATYPAGATEKEITSLEDAVSNMLANGYVVAPSGATLDLKDAANGNNLPQAAMIDLCNREMSKALRSQAMVSETQAAGARAASETAAARQEMVNNADRDIAAASFSDIFRWITIFNFGADVAPPILEFYTEQQATKERAEAYQLVADMGAKPSMRGLLEEMNMQKADDEADAILPSVKPAAALPASGLPAPSVPNAPPLSFSAPAALGFEFNESNNVLISAAKAEINLENAAVDAVDVAFSDAVIEPLAEMLAQFEADGKTLGEFHESLGVFFGGIEQSKIIELTQQALTLSALQGANEVVVEVDDGN